MRTNIFCALWWIPNALSVYRGFVAAPIILAYIVWEGMVRDPIFDAGYEFLIPRLIVFGIGVFALATEWLDGKLARAFVDYGWETPLGRRLDPLADKLLAIAVALGILIYYGVGDYLYVFVPLSSAILAYSIYTSYLRLVGRVEYPNDWAKRKTAALMVAKGFFLGAIAFEIFPTFAYDCFIIAMGLVGVGAILCWPALQAYRDLRTAVQPAE